MNFDTLALIVLVLAAIPCGLFLLNFLVYRPLPRSSRRKEALTCIPEFQSDSPHVGCDGEKVSVLIPARNEEKNIRTTLEAVLANRGLEFEVIVLDDHSTDGTANIVSEFATRDPRVRLESAPPLPVGWCGKQHACHVLANLARHPLLVFIDADVRLAPDALTRMVMFMGKANLKKSNANRPHEPGVFPGVQNSARSFEEHRGEGTEISVSSETLRFNLSFTEGTNIALASGIPRQELGTFSERLLLPLIHFVLLGFLPMHAMRRTRWPSMSAGCGQLFIARRDAYEQCGGHSMLRDSLHDGIKLPRVFRQAGFRTDLFDATDLATCRMYHTNAETWRGLGKNATEGLAAPGTIVPMTALLLGGQVLPPVLCAFAPLLSATGLAAAVVAMALAFLPRLVAAALFRQSLGGAMLHPLGVLALLVIQWHALARHILGRPAEWKGRSYAPVAVSQPSKIA